MTWHYRTSENTHPTTQLHILGHLNLLIKIHASCTSKTVLFWFVAKKILHLLNTLRTADADLRFYITTVQDGWCNSAFLTCACFPCTVHLIMQYIEPVSEWSCWRMFIETWPHSELTFRHRASSIWGKAFRYSPENDFYIFNQQIYFIIWYLLDRASLI